MVTLPHVFSMCPICVRYCGALPQLVSIHPTYICPTMILIFFGATQTVNAFATGHVEQLKTYVIQMFRF